MRSAPDETLAELARALDESGVAWYLFGAQAALIYGAQRLTVDVDVTVHLHDMPTPVRAYLVRSDASREFGSV